MSTRIDLLELSKEEREKIAMNCVEVILEEITKNKQAFVGLVGRAISLSNSQVGPGDFLTFSFPISMLGARVIPQFQENTFTIQAFELGLGDE